MLTRTLGFLLCVMVLLPGCDSAPSKAVTLTKDNFEQMVLQSKQPVLVDFWAEWCAPCKALDPTIKAVAKEVEGTAVVGKVNIDDYPDIAEKYSIQVIPTLLVFKNGEVQRRFQGPQNKQFLTDLLRTMQ